MHSLFFILPSRTPDLRTFETLVSYEVNYWLLGYSPMRAAPKCRETLLAQTHRRVQNVRRRTRATSSYRNSQFARAFTFEFPLLTFRIVVLYSTLEPPLRSKRNSRVSIRVVNFETTRVIDAAFVISRYAYGWLTDSKMQS